MTVLSVLLSYLPCEHCISSVLYIFFHTVALISPWSPNNCYYCHSFIGICRMRRFLAILRSFFHSSLLCTLSLHQIPPASLPSFFTSSCYLFLCLPLSFVVSKFILKTCLGILFSSILFTCQNQHNLFSLIASGIVGFLTIV